MRILSQDCFFKIYPFSQCSIMQVLSNIKCPYIHGAISGFHSGLSVLSHWSMHTTQSKLIQIYNQHCSPADRFSLFNYSCPLLSHIHFRISLLTGTKKNLLKTCWDYFKIFQSTWAGTDIFTMLSLPIHKYGISIFYLSTLISLNIILSTEILHIFGLFPSRYFSFFKISHICSTTVTM